MSQGIRNGGTTIYAIGVVEEAHDRLHHKVPLMIVSTTDGITLSGSMMFFVNSANIFNAVSNAGIVFEGPAPFDAQGACMRFMFRRDAELFYETFKRD